jgi:hypothetical protein
MQKVFRFWWLCLCQSARGNAPFANDWPWIFATPLWQAIGGTVGGAIGAFLARYWRDAPVISPDTFFGAFIGGLFGFGLTWLIVFVGRLFVTPAALYYAEKDRADSLAAQGIVPDVIIETTSSAQIIENPPSEKSEGGIFIVFSMVKVINRDDRRASLEFHLRVNLGPRDCTPKIYTRFDQIPEGWAEESEPFRVAARRLPSILNIEPRITEDGCFAFFRPYHVNEVTKMLLQMGKNKKETSLLEVVKRYDFDIVVDEHISATHHEIPAGKHIHYSLRPKKEDD